MRGGQIVTLRIAGKDYRCLATAIHDDVVRVEPALRELLQQFPGDAPYYDIDPSADGHISSESLRLAANQTVMVEALLDT